MATLVLESFYCNPTCYVGWGGGARSPTVLGGSEAIGASPNKLYLGTKYEECQPSSNVDMLRVDEQSQMSMRHYSKLEIWLRGAVFLGENRKENRQIKFRVNDLEFQRLEQMAKDFGMSVPNFCKKKAQGARMKSPKIDREGAFEIARQLRGIGVNVNQLSKRANEGKAIPKEDLQAVERELHALWQQFNSAIQK